MITSGIRDRGEVIVYREFSKRLEIMRITDRHTNYKVGRIGKVLGCVEFFFREERHLSGACEVNNSAIVMEALLKTARGTSRMEPQCHIFTQANVSI